MSIDHSNLIVAGLVHSEEYTRCVLPHLDSSYFDNRELKWFIEQYHQYFEKHNAIPPREVFDIELQNDTTLSSEEVDRLEQCLDTVCAENWQRAINKASQEWLVNTTEKWCRDRALYNAIRKSLDAIEQTRDSGTPPEWVPDMFEQALNVSFKGTEAHDFFNDADARFEFYHEKWQRIPFAIESINRSTRGGLPRKALGVMVAPTGVGKSMWLTHNAAHMMMNGYNVLYITLELAEEYISQRVETTLFDLDIDHLEMLEHKKYRSKIEQLQQQTHGRLKVQEYPPSTISATHIKTLLHELRTKDDFEPDVIMIDYLNLMESGRSGRNEGSYEKNKKVAEDIRAIGVRHDALTLSATQTNREGQNASDYELNEVSECLAPDTIVMTKQGEKRLDQISIGEKVLGSDGWVTVTMTHHPKKKKAYRIRTASGKEVVCSADHQFPTANGRMSINDGLVPGITLNTQNES